MYLRAGIPLSLAARGFPPRARISRPQRVERITYQNSASSANPRITPRSMRVSNSLGKRADSAKIGVLFVSIGECQ